MDVSSSAITKTRIILLLLLLLLCGVAYYWPRRWHYIVIHHSAGNYGNIEHLQKVHRVRQYQGPIDAMASHYAIGKGNGMDDGAIESDLRLQYHLWGVHGKKSIGTRIFAG